MTTSVECHLIKWQGNDRPYRKKHKQGIAGKIERNRDRDTGSEREERERERCIERETVDDFLITTM